MTLVAGAKAELAAHVWDREANEHYVEPEWCSQRLFEEERFYGGVWDPCCGFGRIPDSAKAYGPIYASDLIERGYVGEPTLGWLRRDR